MLGNTSKRGAVSSRSEMSQNKSSKPHKIFNSMKTDFPWAVMKSLCVIAVCMIPLI